MVSKASSSLIDTVEEESDIQDIPVVPKLPLQYRLMKELGSAMVRD